MDRVVAGASPAPGIHEPWRSLVARWSGGPEVAGANPVGSITSISSRGERLFHTEKTGVRLPHRRYPCPCSSTARTSVRHTEDGGAIPSWGIRSLARVAQEQSACLVRRRFGCDSRRGLHTGAAERELSLIRTALGVQLPPPVSLDRQPDQVSGSVSNTAGARASESGVQVLGDPKWQR